MMVGFAVSAVQIFNTKNYKWKLQTYDNFIKNDKIGTSYLLTTNSLNKEKKA